MVKGIGRHPYKYRLRRQSTFSPECHWLCGDPILTFSIFFSCLDLPQADIFESPPERDLRGHDSNLGHRNFHWLGKIAAFAWIKLLIEIFNPPTLKTFKRMLD